jgi:hypothetical protein
VQAALELGKSHDSRAFAPLSDALDDGDASVRAAAAAALGKLGEPRAIQLLKLHLSDSSSNVRSAIQGALVALTPTQVEASPAPETHRIVVKLGGVHNSTRVKSPALEREILAESRKKLTEMPGVEVVSTEPSTAKSDDAPQVMITPSIQRLAASRDGDSIVYSASIEYILHTLPDEAILGRISGSASAAATEKEAADRTATAVLRREVLAAAIQSALSRAPRALLAAARL